MKRQRISQKDRAVAARVAGTTDVTVSRGGILVPGAPADKPIAYLRIRRKEDDEIVRSIPVFSANPKHVAAALRSQAADIDLRTHVVDDSELPEMPRGR